MYKLFLSVFLAWSLPFWASSQAPVKADEKNNPLHREAVLNEGVGNLILGPLPIVDLGPDFSLCLGETDTLDADTTALPTTYLWSTGAITRTIPISFSGIYWVIVTNSCGSDSDTVVVDLYPISQVNAGPDDSLCQGQTIALGFAFATAGSLQWTTSGTGTFSSANALNPNYSTGADLGWVSLILTLTDSCGVHADTMDIFISPVPNGIIFVSDSLCYGDTVVLTYVGSADTVSWATNGTGTLLFSDSSTAIYIPDSAETGPVTFDIVTGTYCGVWLDSLQVILPELNQAGFNWNPTEIYPGTTVNFNDQSLPGNTTFLWNFGDSTSTSDLQNPSHVYNQPGTYPVRFVVVDQNGCPAEITQDVIVLPSDTLIPNVFTPNGDGINDLFTFKLPVVRTFELKIFDRWGKQVFYTNTATEFWDGRTNGKDCPEGVYFFEMNVTLPEAGTMHEAGNLTLVR